MKRILCFFGLHHWVLKGSYWMDGDWRKGVPKNAVYIAKCTRCGKEWEEIC